MTDNVTDIAGSLDDHDHASENKVMQGLSRY